MVNRIIIIADNQKSFLSDFYMIKYAKGIFEIVAVYLPKGDADDIEMPCDVPVLSYEEVGSTLNEFEFEYILNRCCFEEKMKSILKMLTSEEKILNYFEFADKFLDETGRMLCLEKKIELDYSDIRNKVNVFVGDFSYGKPYIANCIEDVKLEIGRFCSIAENVGFLVGYDHRTDWNSTYPFSEFMLDYASIEGHPCSKGDIVVGNDVWIGKGATILSGVTIGDGAVIGADAVVAHSVPSYSIVAGNPAKVVKKRFDDETIAKLEEMQWWDWEYKYIYHAIPKLMSSDIDGLYCYYQEYVK